MNYMKTQSNGAKLRQLRALSLSIGQFIRYWGFRRVHGAIWTQLYLSPVPLSGTLLAGRLKLSKALISPGLNELENWGLIVSVESGDDKTKLYTAKEDVTEVIHRVLKHREQKMINEVASRLTEIRAGSPPADLLDPDRLEKLEGMVTSAQVMLRILVGHDDLVALPQALSKKGS